MDIQKIQIKDVKNLLNEGKKVKVKTLNNQFIDVVKYVEKGFLNTYEVILKNGKSIKVSNDHRFFTNVGWLETKNIIPNKTSILCDDNEYHLVERVDFIGKRKIVDITVNHPDECYFGNGMLNHNTGKSLVAAQILATVQRRGGVAVYIDTENALSMEFLEAIGIDVKNMVYAPLDTIEDIFTSIEAIIENVRKTDSDKLVAIVVDSVAGASTKQEMEDDYDKDGYATGKAIIISKALRKITNLIGREKIALVFTNQLRTRMGAMFGDPYTTSGGKAIGFHSSVRIRLKNKGQIKHKSGTREETIGITVHATVTKNRVAPPFRTGEFDIYFDRGIDDTNSWLKILKELKIVKAAGAWYTLTNEKGEEIRFQSKEWSKILENETLKEFIYQQICNNVIMKYKPESKLDPDEIEITNGVESGNDE